MIKKKLYDIALITLLSTLGLFTCSTIYNKIIPVNNDQKIEQKMETGKQVMKSQDAKLGNLGSVIATNTFSNQSQGIEKKISEYENKYEDKVIIQACTMKDNAGKSRAGYFKISKEEFVKALIPFIIEKNTEYAASHKEKGGHEGMLHQLSVETAKMYAEWIFDYSLEFNASLLRAATIPFHETYFSNVKGDLKFGKNYSEGPYQIRRKTREIIYYMMKTEGIKGALNELPKSLMDNVEYNFMYGIYYLRHLTFLYNDVNIATKLYGGGSNAYLKDVQKKENELIEHLKEKGVEFRFTDQNSKDIGVTLASR